MVILVAPLLSLSGCTDLVSRGPQGSFAAPLGSIDPTHSEVDVGDRFSINLTIYRYPKEQEPFENETIIFFWMNVTAPHVVKYEGSDVTCENARFWETWTYDWCGNTTAGYRETAHFEFEATQPGNGTIRFEGSFLAWSEVVVRQPQGVDSANNGTKAR